jgi:hypothetical protein
MGSGILLLIDGFHVGDQCPGAFPRIAKTIEMRDMGEVGANNYSPLQKFPGGDRGEPCVHPEFSDSLLENLH